MYQLKQVTKYYLFLCVEWLYKMLRNKLNSRGAYNEIALPVCNLSILHHVVKLCFLSKPGGWFRSNWPIRASPLRISFDSYPDAWHQRRASNPNTYQPRSLSSFSTEKTAGLFSQLRSPAVSPACQVTQRLPPSHQLSIIEAKIIPYAGFQYVIPMIYNDLF